jgi:esterase/lipase superfamily enzyme
VNPGFRNLVLAAPDINIADFSVLSEVLRASAARTTIYSSSRDVALQVSKAFHSYQRLGEAPPKVLDARIDTVDVSAIPRDVLGHSYFGDSATVLRDLFLLIRQGLDPAKRFLRPMALGEQRYWLVPKE